MTLDGALDRGGGVIRTRSPFPRYLQGLKD